MMSDLFSQRGKKFPFVVSGNELRQALNWKCVKSLSQLFGIKPIVCCAEMKPAYSRFFNGKDTDILLQTMDNQTANLPAQLPLLPGMPIRITQNLAVELCLANGTEGNLVGVEFPRGTTFEATSCFDVSCMVASNLPDVAYVQASIVESVLPSRFESIPAKIPANSIPLFPIQTPNFSADLKGRKKLTAGNRMTMRQLPFVPAFSATTYKVQGVTADALLSFPFFSTCPVTSLFAALYVVLSRVRTSKSLFLLEKITKRHQKHFVPPKELLQEQERLEQLHCETIGRLGV